MYINGSAQAMMVLGVCATVAISVISIGRAYVRSIEASRKPPRPDLAPDVQDRMSRIEQAVDAIAIEVERVSEGQRFVTRLLSERAPAIGAAPAEPVRVPVGEASRVR
jgi:hypothetical protein